MMRDIFNTIVVSPEPRGRWLSCILDGALKPGTVVQPKAATAPVNGNHTYVAYNRDADGNRPVGGIAILVEDTLQGLGIDDAYTTGSQALIYLPLPGDEFLMVLQDVSGTGDTHAIGELLIIDSGTGELIATAGTPETEAFTLLEALAAPTENVLAHVRFNGY